MSVSASLGRVRPSESAHKRTILPGVLVNAARKWVAGGRAPRRSRLLPDLWIDLKCYAAPHVREIAPSRLRGIDRVRVEGPVGRHSPLVVTALATLLQSETIFELGPDTADTSWLLAHNLPDARIFWLDDGIERPRSVELGHAERTLRGFGKDPGLRTDLTLESNRLTRLRGDSATFDFLPYSGTADLVYVEASHRHDRMRSDTEAAFGLLSELGCIVWDGYSGDSSVYAYLNELARDPDCPIFHIRGTRLAFHSRWDIVIPDVG